jgi:integrase
MRADNPCKGIKRFPEEKHEGWLTGEQLQRLELALDQYPVAGAADALRLLVLTGSREGEVLNATWDQFDLGRGIWTKPSHATKENKTEHVPLSDATLIVLRRMAKQREPAIKWLFPGQSGEDARSTLRNAWRIVCKNAGMATEHRWRGKRGGMLMRWKPTIRINDLRHSFASHLVQRGASLYQVGKLMGHTQPNTTQRYAHCADAPLRSIANDFAEVLDAKPEVRDGSGLVQ